MIELLPSVIVLAMSLLFICICAEYILLMLKMCHNV